MTDPKPCPVCGAPAAISGDGEQYVVECPDLDGCNVTGPVRRTAEDAIAAWNSLYSAEKDVMAALRNWAAARRYYATHLMAEKRHVESAADQVLDALALIKAKETTK